MRLLALVKSFPVIQIKEIRPVVMAVLKNMSYIEDRQDNISHFFIFLPTVCSLDPVFQIGTVSVPVLL
jgi:hypothetical protein